MNSQDPQSRGPDTPYWTPTRVALIVAVVFFVSMPFLILVIMAIPATHVQIQMEDNLQSDLTIKVTGYQWKWGYEYVDSGITFFSSSVNLYEQIGQADANGVSPDFENSLIQVDNVMVVPSGRRIRLLITSNDVIHAWWIPQFGAKKDAIPGYINELWFLVDEGKEGTYRGQCAALCGKGHASMLVAVNVVTGTEFDAWVLAEGRVGVQ